MNKNIFLLTTLIVSTLLFSCNKNISKTKKEILISKTWIYDEYFRYYNSANTVLFYKKGKGQNLLDLSVNKVNFMPDGSYWEVSETGQKFTGTWSFKNNETELEIVNAVGIYTSKIILLDNNHFYWYDVKNSNGTYGKMIPQ